MSGRPKYSPSNWSTDDDFTAPGQDWDGQPTKIQPALSKQTGGFQPTERPPAEYLNWLWNNFSQHLQYADGIQGKNWRRAVTIPDVNLELSGEEKAICWDPVNRIYWVAGPKEGPGFAYAVLYSANGTDWIDSGFVASTASSGIAASDNGWVANILVNNRVEKHDPADDGITWTNTDTASATSFHGGIWDPYLGLFWFIGKGTDTHPGIWSAPENISATTKRTIATPGSGVGNMKLIAVGPSLGVASGDWNNGSGNVPQLWARTGDETQTWTKIGGTGAIFGGGLMALDYDTENGLFLATVSDGSFWVSSDGGVNWVQKAAPDTNRIFFPYHLAAYGSLYIATALSLSIGAVLFTLQLSKDLGVTWEHVQWPALSPDDEPRTLVLGNGEFVLLTQGTGIDPKASFSLKL